MLNWIRKALHGGQTENLQNMPDVSNKWIEQLKAYIAPIDHVKDGRHGLGRDIINYILLGEPTAIMNEIHNKGTLRYFFDLYPVFHVPHVGGQRQLTYEDFEDVPATIALRWARVLTAVSAGNFAMEFPENEHWPEVLLMSASGHGMFGWNNRAPKLKYFTASKFEQMLSEAGLDESALLTSAFNAPVKRNYYAKVRASVVAQLVGYPDYLHRHIKTVQPLLLSSEVEQRLLILELLASAHTETLEIIANELCEFATCGSKQVRIVAEPLVRRGVKTAVAPLKKIALIGKPDQRGHALRLLWIFVRGADISDVDKLALGEFCQDTAAKDKSAAVRALAKEWTQNFNSDQVDTKLFNYEIPKIDWSDALTPELDSALKILWRDLNLFVEKTNKGARERHAAAVAKGHQWPLHQQAAFTEDELQQLQKYISSNEPAYNGKPHDGNIFQFNDLLSRFFNSTNMSPVALLKTMVFFTHAVAKNGLPHFFVFGFNAMHARTGKPSLLELEQMLEPIGYTEIDILKAYCMSWNGLANNWSAEQVWPFFARHRELLIQSLLKGESSYSFDRKKLYQAIAILPQPFDEVINALYGIALGTAKSERREAQDALEHLPGKETRIIAALSNGKAEMRTVAAQWLMRLNYIEALPHLEKAVVTEKNDVTKGALLDTLQKFGQPVEKYLDRAALSKEASKFLAKGLPKELEWFPWDAMPIVRWSDSGDQVPVEVLKQFLAHSVKQKSPEPNAVLRKFCAMFEDRTREQFGQYVLEAWIREDIRPISPDEAMRRAKQYANFLFNSMQSSPQYFQNSPKLGKSEAELTTLSLPGFLRQPAGSAIASKGILAVAAACAAERAAAVVWRYLKDYYGTRAAHGKALIAMLAWIDHPGATQLMLSVGNRFRTKSFQDEAIRQAQALAERKGWTLAELADRTIPTAGFDEKGELELSYGERSFTATLMSDFKIDLFNPDRKKVASLPEPRMDDDAELAKAAKQAYSSAKKEIKNIVNLQTDRLYEALCTERDWSYEDWEAYLNKHAIVRRLIQRLVWVEVVDGKMGRAFRPLDDGTLTDCDDNEIKLAEGSRIRIAHDSILSAEQVNKWQQHLADYEIVPLFQQLGKGTYSLPRDKIKAVMIKDFEGHLIETFSLRSAATKLGYTRGQAEDGGWFRVYEKRFPTLGLVAVIEFSGNSLPEENRTAALFNLSFNSTSDQGWQRGQIELSKIPKILLSECYNDIRLIAASGSGYDAEWEKKSGY